MPVVQYTLYSILYIRKSTPRAIPIKMSTLEHSEQVAAPEHSDSLRRAHAHPRDERIHFHPGPHVYTVDCHDDPSKSEYTSVTTWVHSHFPVFDSDAVIDKMMASPYWSKGDKYRKYAGKTKDDIKAEWDANRDSAAAAGTRMHAAIETYYNDRAGDDADPLAGDGVTDDTRTEMEYFARFDRTFRQLLRPYRTEWTVFHEELKLSGTIDMLFENLDPATGKPDGTFAIYDWKRCKEIVQNNAFNKWALTPGMETVPDTNYWHYSLQLNLYKLILTEKYGIRVSSMYIVCLHPHNANLDYLRFEIRDMQPLLRTVLALPPLPASTGTSKPRKKQ
jgi:hypothetical protein